MQSVLQYRRIREDVNSDIEYWRAVSKRESSDSLSPQVSANPLEASTDPFLVEWSGPDDPLSPRNWSQARRAAVFLIVWINVFAVDWAASADSQANARIAREFHVSEEAETLSPTLYTFGIALGALFAGPLAETVGRTPIYVFTRVLHVAMLIGVALAPNFGAQCAFRFLAGLGASTLLAIHGASVADLYNPVERTLAWPAISLASFLGTAFSPIAGGWIAYSNISWRWCEWVALILSAVTLPLSAFLLPETFSPIILSWKAKHVRNATGDDRFMAHLDKQKSITQRFKIALQRALHMVTREPIVPLLGSWLVLVYIVVFSFLQGFSYIFGTYNFSRGLIGTSFATIGVGVLLWSCSAPLYWRLYKNKVLALEKANGDDMDVKHVPGFDLPDPEYRLWSAIPVAVVFPVSLFWLGWTNYPSISPWSSLGAITLFGICWAGIYVTVYQYILDVYGIYAGSALAIVTFFRYVASGGINLIARPMYDNIGVHWTMTWIGCMAVLLAAVPLLLLKYGERLRMRSHFASKYARPAYERRRTGRASNWT